MEERLSPFFEQLDGVYRQGFPEAVEAFLRENLCRAETETDSELERAGWNELGSFFRGAGRYEESLSAFRRAEVMAGKLQGRDSGAYATVLNNMAGTCRLLHRASEAESLFLRAMECYQQAGLEDSDAYTSVLNNLSLVYRETGELGKAIDYLLRALKRLEGCGDRRAELAITYNNLTTLYQAAGDREILASRLGISPHQLSYVTHSGEGEGLLFYGNVILPFVDHFPRDTQLYRLLTTRPGEVRKEAKA